MGIRPVVYHLEVQLRPVSPLAVLVQFAKLFNDLLKFVISLRRITDGYTTLAEVYRYIIEDDEFSRIDRWIGPVDVVLFLVKSYDTESAARQLAPLLGPDTGVISLQNGIGQARSDPGGSGPFFRAYGKLNGYWPIGSWYSQARLELGQVFVRDDRLGLSWAAPAADISLRRDPRGLAGDIGLAFRMTFLNKCDELERGTVAEFFQRAFGQDLPESTARVRVA